MQSSLAASMALSLAVDVACFKQTAALETWLLAIACIKRATATVLQRNGLSLPARMPSIACWGCVAMVPAVGGGHPSVYMLYCSVVLDHDTLAAKMYLEQCLADLRVYSGADWARVKTLRFVCDVGPHFRS